MNTFSTVEIFEAIDDMFDGMTVQTLPHITNPNGYIKYPVPSFPPVDLTLTTDNELEFVFALAGYQKDELEISFDGDFMILKGTILQEEDKEKKELKIIKKSIKKNNFEYKYAVPVSKFKQNEASAEFENGLLKITIPPVDKKDPIKINVK